MNRIARPREAAEAILSKLAEPPSYSGKQALYQHLLHGLREDLRNGTDIDAGIEWLSSQGYISQAQKKGAVVLTDKGYEAISTPTREATNPDPFQEPTMNSAPQVDFVAIFALEKELQAFLSHLQDYQVEGKGDSSLYRAQIPLSEHEGYRVVALRLPRMGNYEAAAATTRAIDVWNPRFVLLGGIAGGTKRPEVQLGDVIVADLVVAYEPGKERPDGFERRLRYERPAEALVKAAHKLRPRDWALNAHVQRPDGQGSRIVPRVHFGTVVSGEKVIASKKIVHGLSRDLASAVSGSSGQIAAIEMEGYGTALASYRAPTAPGMFMAKSICDWADHAKGDSWQDYAADVSASFLVALLRSRPIPTLKSPPAQAQHIDARPYSGRSKVGLCKRMDDAWELLADYYDVPLPERRRFRHGWECQDLWAWLENRQRLGGLPEALTAIGRSDLVAELIPAE